MAFWLAFLALPKEAIYLIIATFIVLLLSAVSIVFPLAGSFIVGLGFLIAAFYFKDVSFKLKRTEISLAAILAMMGIAIILVNVLALNFGDFFKGFAVVSMSVSTPMAMAVTGEEVSVELIDWEMYGITPQIIGGMLTVIVGSAVGSISATKYLVKKKKRRLK